MKNFLHRIFLCLLVMAGLSHALSAKEVKADMQHLEVKIDFSKASGEAMKPLHGVNASPVALEKPIPEFQAAGIPFVRIHDFGGLYGGAVYFDIPNIFADFEADETDPANYHFEFSDAAMKQLIDSGCKIQYRLGVTIENNYRIRAWRINPPADFAKWARICEQVIRHYNEGWANGFHYGIEYWEIWNEPENPPCWTGTKEQFFEFYKVVSRHLKKCFPKLKIGGYGSCGFYEITYAKENCPPYRTFKEWADSFLDFAQKEKLPLDFFTWHRYYFDTPDVLIAESRYIREQLDKHGFGDTESFLNEWNYCDDTPEQWDNMRTSKGAASIAHAMIRMQNLPVDKAMYYVAQPGTRYGGLYYFPSCKVTPTFYSLFVFNRLYQLKRQVECDVKGAGAVGIAACDGKMASAMFANASVESVNLKLDCLKAPAGQVNAYLTDESQTMQKIDFVPDRMQLPPHSVMLIEWNRPELTRTQSAGNRAKFGGLDSLP